MTTEETFRAYVKRFGQPPLPKVEYPVSKYGFLPPESDDDLTPLLSKCLANNRPATFEECTKAAYFRDGWYWGHLSGTKDGERIVLRARSFDELKRIGATAFDKGGLFYGVEVDPD